MDSDMKPTAAAENISNDSNDHEVREAMRKYWEQYSVQGTVEEMMLDDAASFIDQHERPEILSMLPEFQGKKVLELGAGIGRFTAPLADHAEHVVAVDFMQTNVDVNARQNGHRKNLEVICEDVTKLQLEEEKFDLIFSNWLMMYLTDDEVVELADNMFKWLKPGGHIFFRESCFHQSGNLKRESNPSVYRSPQLYNSLFSRKHVAGSEYTLRMVMAKTVDTYARIKGNRNQMCWLWEKVKLQEDSSNGNATQEFLDSQQYAVSGILRYEKIFGQGFVSTGGKDTTTDFAKLLNLQPGQYVLDVGCGIGGGCFYLAETYGARVLGLDLSTNMVGIALDRSLSLKLDVTFEIADATQCNFPAGTFDVVYSRDTILHIQDKLSLFKRFFSWLKPGGRLLISDYCRGEDNESHRLSEEFKEYVAQRGYHLHTVSEYGELITEAGFVDVVAEDRTWQFVESLNKELARMADPECRNDFLKEFSESDLKYLEDGWVAKVQRCDLKDQTWGLFVATKPQ